MASFIAICNDCKHSLKDGGVDLSSEEFAERVFFETAHSINATIEQIAEAMICPRCDSRNCSKTFLGYDVVGYVRGDGYLDVAGAKRDMSLFHLTGTDNDTGKTLDPYAEYRVPGEVDDLKHKLIASGKHQPNRKHFDIKKS